MKKVIKQVLGIDVAQLELVVCLAKLNDDLSREPYAHKTFLNSPKGFKELCNWVDASTDHSLAVRYVMEATGVYHESLACFLTSEGREVSIVLPNKISHYCRSLEIKTVTDKTASQAIAQFGIERNTDVWQPPLPVYKRMKQLTRERSQVIDERTMLKNQLHAESVEAEPNKNSVIRIKKRIDLLTKQEKEIITELRELIKTDEKAAVTVKLLCSIPGIGMLTAAGV